MLIISADAECRFPPTGQPSSDDPERILRHYFPYRSLEELQADVDIWVKDYNEQRIHYLTD
jgi:hypothetical protein